MKRIQTTSTESYRQTKLLGDEATYRQRCLTYLRAHEATDGEAMRDIGVKDVNCYRPERTRLFQAGKLECVGKRVCLVSGRTCKVWRTVK
jgi:hypothetical protein